MKFHQTNKKMPKGRIDITAKIIQNRILSIGYVETEIIPLNT